MHRPWIIAASLLLCVLAGNARAQWSWEPVGTTEREATAGVVDPKAGAEALFLKLRIEDVFDGQDLKSVLDEYIRIKVFSDAEAQRLTTVRIPHAARGTKLSDVAARTVQADGTVLDVASRDMKDISLARSEGHERKALSFALPHVAPGTIIEYRWRETRYDVLADGITLEVQRDVPIRRAQIDIKPLALDNWRLQIMPFSLSANVPVESVEGWYRCTAENVRAIPDEPYAPPGRRQRGFVFAYYLRANITDKDKYWAGLSANVARELEEHVGAEDEVAALARNIVGDAGTDSVKLQRLVRWCRHELRDISFEEYRARLRRERDPKISDILAARTGTDFEAAAALAALAQSLGLHAQLVLLESRTGLPYRSSVLNGAALSIATVLVDCQQRSQLCIPRGRGVSWNELPWEAEGMRGIRCSLDSSAYMTSQVAAPSSIHRAAEANLLPNGDVEGTLRMLLAGHWAEDWFDRVHDASDREAALRSINRWGPGGAALSDVATRVAGADSDTVVVTAHFRWPGFATATEKRVLLQPALWAARAPALFSAESRLSSVMFPFSWSESDSTTFHLPAGLRIEAGDEPATFEAAPLVWHALAVARGDTPETFVFLRHMNCATAEHTSFPRSSYSDVRQAFQSVATRDQYTLTLTRSPP